MQIPRAVANFNSRITNPVARSITPWLPGLGTLEHVGRISSRHYRTPLLVFPIRDGFVTRSAPQLSRARDRSGRHMTVRELANAVLATDQELNRGIPPSNASALGVLDSVTPRRRAPLRTVDQGLR